MITIGSDFSRSSDAAIRLAAAWSAWHDEPLRLVHVLEGPARRADDAHRGALRTELEDQAARCGAGSPGIRIGIDIDEETDATRALAPGPGATSVVGAEGSSATLLRRAGHVPATLATSLAEGAALLVAPQGWKPAAATRSRRSGRSGHEFAPPPRPERILVGCALDGRDAALLSRACAVAASLSSAQVHVAHVVDVSAARHHPPAIRAAVRSGTDPAVDAAENALRDLAAAAPLDAALSRPIAIHVVRQGPIERDLAGLARSQAADLVIVGSGGVAARLVGFTGCPLLVLG